MGSFRICCSSLIKICIFHLMQKLFPSNQSTRWCDKCIARPGDRRHCGPWVMDPTPNLTPSNKKQTDDTRHKALQRFRVQNEFESFVRTEIFKYWFPTLGERERERERARDAEFFHLCWLSLLALHRSVLFVHCYSYLCHTICDSNVRAKCCHAVANWVTFICSTQTAVDEFSVDEAPVIKHIIRSCSETTSCRVAQPFNPSITIFSFFFYFVFRPHFNSFFLFYHFRFCHPFGNVWLYKFIDIAGSKRQHYFNWFCCFLCCVCVAISLFCR